MQSPRESEEEGTPPPPSPLKEQEGRFLCCVILQPVQILIMY
jgi:hypothetical protein